MTLTQGVVDVLEADAGVGAIADDRIYPLVLPQEPTLPAIVYQRISASRDYTLSPTEKPFAKTRFQFACWASHYLDADNLAKAVIAALSNFRGTLTSGETVGATFIVGDMDLEESQTHTVRRIIDAQFAYQEV